MSERGKSACSTLRGVTNWVDEEEEDVKPRWLTAPTAVHGSDEASSSSSGLVHDFVSMGFPEDIVIRAVRESDGADSEAILELILTYSALSPEDVPPECEQGPSFSGSRPPADEFTSFGDDVKVEFDMDEWLKRFDDEADEFDEFEDLEPSEAEALSMEDTLSMCKLMEMGFEYDEIVAAMKSCGPGTSETDLADAIYAAQIEAAENEGYQMPTIRIRSLGKDDSLPKYKKRKRSCGGQSGPTDDLIVLPKPMIGFGVPDGPPVNINQWNRDAVPKGPPYFYYENVALAPKGVWATISRNLYDIQPEFVDSKFFSACHRKRGYIHNLPIVGRFALPPPAKTIQSAFPDTVQWWPSWDPRTKFNCLQTCTGSAKLTSRLSAALNADSDPPSIGTQKYVMFECRKWNLVWVGRNRPVALEPHEVEKLLGFPPGHTRGPAKTDRLKALGNSFQVDTVAYHLSPLKKIFPNGINVLSLFTGIGGGEVALDRLGIKMKNVLSVEISDVSSGIFRSWWDQTQTGRLIEIHDVQQLGRSDLENFINRFGGFDLVIGGSPCNNLAGSNRHHRTGLEGEQSALFYEYVRILDLVRNIMDANRR